MFGVHTPGSVRQLLAALSPLLQKTGRGPRALGGRYSDAALMPARLQTLAQAETRGVLTTLTGMLYGGKTEELLLRWCVMSLFAWCGWRFAHRSGERLRAPIMWAAITLSALVFGLGHLPAATAMQVPLTDALVPRTLALNGLAGVVYGTLF